MTESSEIYKIVFQNEHLIIVDKQGLVLSVPSRIGEKEIRPVLGLRLESDLGIKLYPVHRLDYEVSGLIMFAKTPQAQKITNSWFEKKEITKTYFAISSPIAQSATESENHFTLGENYLWKCRLMRGKKRAYEASHGKESLTKAKLIEVRNDLFHWELNPVTGRSHQLRYELFRHGHPIVGDELYSSTKKSEFPGIALRAFKIDFQNTKDAHVLELPPFLEISKNN